MFAELFGSVTAGRVLVFVAKHHEGYTREIASSFGISPQMVHEQLKRFERAGLMTSRRLGNVRLFSLNPSHPLAPELLELLRKAFESLTEDEQATILCKSPAAAGSGPAAAPGKEPPANEVAEADTEQLEEFLRRM